MDILKKLFLLRMPKTDVGYTEFVDVETGFWNWFIVNEHDYYFGTDHASTREKLFDKLLVELQKVNNGFFLSLALFWIMGLGNLLLPPMGSGKIFQL